MNRSELIEQALTNCEKVRLLAEEIGTHPEESLRFKPAPEKWSALECIEHLNTVYEHYLPRIQNVLSQAEPSSNEVFSSGLFGGMMTRSMLPKTEGATTMSMKTFKRMEPQVTDKLTRVVLKQYRLNVSELKSCIEKANDYDLKKLKVASAIGPILRFRLGDAFQFVLAHDMRHLKQAQQILSKLEVKKV
ncbi:DinB family protein [Sediminitomix flava]|uniref:DinB family protein n=1 Tax=Sediminitomix flava TaxID=379075 RepID=A0A315ZHI1_SEDFL|nr:DinB family protein [Sediminitomix flava]PWJ44610.1 DinB family protein [Sediminitomix flava]